MKKTISILTALSLITILMPLTISEVNATSYDDTDNDCYHLHLWGISMEWWPWDELTAVGIGANFAGEGYGYENFFFRRAYGYALDRTYVSGSLCCYMWMEPDYNYWPYYFSGCCWIYGWIQNFNPPPDGQYYYRHDYNRECSYYTTEIWAAAESWFVDPFYGQYWDCFAYAHLPGGYP